MAQSGELPIDLLGPPWHKAASCVPAALAATPGPPGIQVAHHWLARLMVGLADKVTVYRAYVYTPEKPSPRNPKDLIDAVPVTPAYIRSSEQRLSLRQ